MLTSAIVHLAKTMFIYHNQTDW